MMRITTLLLCLILAAAAAGRYKAEIAVRAAKGEIHSLEKKKSAELSDIQVLRAEVAYLESPERLEDIAEKFTELEPLSGSQLMTAEDFEVAFDDGASNKAVKAVIDTAAPVEVADLGD
ncbi:MAG: hypothetical protein R3C60_08535 [Parvularculaceae bacterium]